VPPETCLLPRFALSLQSLSLISSLRCFVILLTDNAQLSYSFRVAIDKFGSGLARRNVFRVHHVIEVLLDVGGSTYILFKTKDTRFLFKFLLSAMYPYNSRPEKGRPVQLVNGLVVPRGKLLRCRIARAHFRKCILNR